MATVTGSDLAAIILLTRDLDFSGKWRALLELLRHWTIPLDQFDRISAYLMVPHTLTPLRNNIAHSAWISGATTHSIQPDWILRPAPGIKPLHNDPGAPSDEFVESDDCWNDLYNLLRITADFWWESSFLPSKQHPLPCRDGRFGCRRRGFSDDGPCYIRASIRHVRLNILNELSGHNHNRFFERTRNAKQRSSLRPDCISSYVCVLLLVHAVILFGWRNQTHKTDPILGDDRSRTYLGSYHALRDYSSLLHGRSDAHNVRGLS